MPTFFIADHSACDKFACRMRSVASINNYRSKCTVLWRMLSFIFAARYKPVQGTVIAARCLDIPDAFVTTGPDESQVSTWFPNETASPHRAASTKPRSRPASRVPHSRHYPRFMVVRANLCAPRETCMAPASPPTVCNRVGPNLANLTDVPVRFDRRSIIVKSTPYLSLPFVEFTRLRVADACGSSMMIDRSIDRLIASWIGDRIIRGILSCSLLWNVKLITKFCFSTKVFQQTLFQFLISINDSKKLSILEKRYWNEKLIRNINLIKTILILYY